MPCRAVGSGLRGGPSEWFESEGAETRGGGGGGADMTVDFYGCWNCRENLGDINVLLQKWEMPASASEAVWRWTSLSYSKNLGMEIFAMVMMLVVR